MYHSKGFCTYIIKRVPTASGGNYPTIIFHTTILPIILLFFAFVICIDFRLTSTYLMESNDEVSFSHAHRDTYLFNIMMKPEGW